MRTFLSHNQKVRVSMGLALLALSLPAYAQPSKSDMMVLREHIEKGNYYMGRQSFQQALDEYEQCLQIDPMNQVAKDNIVLAHNNWGISYFRHQKYDEAKREWEQALKLNALDRNAKNNLAVLKATMAKLGIQPGDSSTTATDDGTGAPKKAAATTAGGSKEMKEPPPAAVILTPIPKAQPPQEESSAAVIITPNGSTSAPATTAAPASTSASTSPPAADAPVATYSAPGDQPAAAPSSPVGSNATIDDKLSAIEQKLYGHKQDKIPILKRIEKIEMDTSGQIHRGTIEERIESLRQNYGV